MDYHNITLEATAQAEISINAPSVCRNFTDFGDLLHCRTNTLYMRRVSAGV
ncbi:hypothetical protein H6P81_020620 [Aristolochia fimbriata]|uniref:Uncharacterized protein n=1 Tax=Aristolochia fimbriata TaxID=158543 RepID=A0AAV7DWQ2_ARIFI|nr:hypothetical protein H6P81_020620 [Aristolochia fimbriata]